MWMLGGRAMPAAGAASSASEHGVPAGAASSASEHGWPAWVGSVAIADIGLGGKAIMGKKWPKHSAELVEQFKGMLNYDGVCGLCLCEVGSWDEPLTPDVREKVEEVLDEAFTHSNASGYGEQRIVWPQGQHPGETLTAWRGDMRVELLGQLNSIPRQPAYRVVERILLLWNAKGGASEHAILIYNNHQPCSQNRPFLKGNRVRFCQDVLADAIRQVTEETRIVGFMFCGDANCGLQHWNTATWQDRTWEMHFERPSYLYASEAAANVLAKRTPGDITVVFVVKG